MTELDLYMNQKGQEYREIDRFRAKRIYNLLKPYLKKIPKIIQIIGTNGKGSTGRFLSLMLMQNDLKILHFTSPHILDFKERFYKNGKIISNEKIINAHKFLQSFDFMQEASYFEYATFLALILAYDVSYLILEAGVGGEYDSTSIVERALVLFTLIDFDHEEMLGNTIDSIATTKLNAMTSNAIVGFQKYNVVYEIAKDIAKKNNTNLIILKDLKQNCINNTNSHQNYKDSNFFTDSKKNPIGSNKIDFNKINLYLKKHNLALFLGENLALALSAVEMLGLKCDLESLAKLDLKGRFEQISKNIIIDVGHNKSAALAIKKSLKNKKVILVYNSYFQKNIIEILGILKENIIRIEILEIEGNKRIIKKENLIKILQSLNIDFSDFRGIQEQNDYLIFGSFSVVEKFITYFERK